MQLPVRCVRYYTRGRDHVSHFSLIWDSLKVKRDRLVKPPAIVFLSHSIFVEGVVNRLGQHHPYLDVHFIDPFQESYIDRILGIKPTMAVIDSEQGRGDKSCVLCNLLEAFPEITILRLKAQERDVQVISSSSYVVDNVQGLIDLLSDCLKMK